jgi:hypothetical protein
MTDPTLNDNFSIPPDLTLCETPPEGSQEPPSVQDLTAQRPKIFPATPNRWPPQLIFDLALGLDCEDETLLQRYELTPQDLAALYALPHFRQEVALMTRELNEKNTIFKTKAKVQAEDCLDDMYDLMKSDDTAASTKLAIFQTLAKFGELEPKKDVVNPLNPSGLQPGQSMRMVVEWSGGTEDYSPVANKEIDVTP